MLRVSAKRMLALFRHQTEVRSWNQFFNPSAWESAKPSFPRFNLNSKIDLGKVLTVKSRTEKHSYSHLAYGAPFVKSFI